MVRYVGEIDFVKGEWCGVELDEFFGKNDGAVAGIRYGGFFSGVWGVFVYLGWVGDGDRVLRKLAWCIWVVVLDVTI